MTPGRVLVVDDAPVNRMLLAAALRAQGHAVTTAENGLQALEALEAAPPEFDVILLDLLMPELDGFETLRRIKESPALRHLPVIVISDLDQIDSIVRCIETGATDYLPKPFNPALLRARLQSSLAEKRLRDLELEYLEQVSRVIAAAGAVEAGHFDPAALDGVASRDDALGALARTFQRMAREVRARQERLERTVRELRIEIDEARKERQVQGITGSDYFVGLRDQAQRLRELLGGTQEPHEPPQSRPAQQ